MTIKLQMFDERREWTTYTGVVWDRSDVESAISDAREWYRPDRYPGGLRLVNMTGRAVWSIGAQQTYSLESEIEPGIWVPVWGEWNHATRFWAEQRREHMAEMLGRPVKVVADAYPRELPLDAVDAPKFSAPEIHHTTDAGRPVPAAIFSHGGTK